MSETATRAARPSMDADRPRHRADRSARVRHRTVLDVRRGAAGTPTTDSAEAGFSRDMQVHHAQAIEMAMEIYRKTDDDELRVLVV